MRRTGERRGGLVIMPSLFPPWSNTVARVALAAAAALTAGGVAAPMVWARTAWRRNELDAKDQPIPFDHRHHVQDDGIDCRYCHNTFERAATAGMPSTEKCMGCHNQVWRDSAALEPVRASWLSRRPIAWRRVHALPDFVFFDHSIHVHAGVGCSSCHGRVDEMARVYQVAPLTMGWCLACHRAPEQRLRPVDRITDMTWDPAEHPREAAATAAAVHVRKLTNCTTCHR